MDVRLSFSNDFHAVPTFVERGIQQRVPFGFLVSVFALFSSKAAMTHQLMNFRRLVVGTSVALAISAAAYFVSPIFLATERAPQISYTLLNAPTPTMAQWQGKVTLVNFWATSCVTCVKEMPEIVATYEKYKSLGFDTLAVAMRYDPPAYVARFAESRRLPFNVAIDNTGEIARQFGQVEVTPTTFIVNKRGEIVKQFVGEPDFAALHLLLEKLLEES